MGDSAIISAIPSFCHRRRHFIQELEPGLDSRPYVRDGAFVGREIPWTGEQGSCGGQLVAHRPTTTTVSIGINTPCPATEFMTFRFKGPTHVSPTHSGIMMMMISMMNLVVP